MTLDLDKWTCVQAGKQLRFFISAEVEERGILCTRLRQVSHREMDEDVCSVSRTPSSLVSFFFFFNHIGTWSR